MPLCGITETSSDAESVEVVHDFEYLQPGKVTIKATFRYKGRDYTSRARMKVIPYENPFKTLKIGSTNLKSIFEGDDQNINGSSCLMEKKVSGKKVLKFKLKKGYKLYKDPEIMSNKSVYGIIPYKKNKKIQFKNVYGIDFHIKDKEGYTLWFSWWNKKPCKTCQ